MAVPGRSLSSAEAAPETKLTFELGSSAVFKDLKGSLTRSFLNFQVDL